MTKSEKVPILGIFSPKTILMFRVGRPTGTTHTFHLSITLANSLNQMLPAEYVQKIYEITMINMNVCTVISKEIPISNCT